MHPLNTLYCPGIQPITKAHEAIVRDYNILDAWLYGRNHGRMVNNYETMLYLPGCVTRGFENQKGDVTVPLLRTGKQTRWDQEYRPGGPLKNQEIAINLPKDRKIRRVIYGSPDSAGLQVPVELDFEQEAPYVRAVVLMAE